MTPFSICIIAICLIAVFDILVVFSAWILGEWADRGEP